jgi:hypothetical protein
MELYMYLSVNYIYLARFRYQICPWGEYHDVRMKCSCEDFGGDTPSPSEGGGGMGGCIVSNGIGGYLNTVAGGMLGGGIRGARRE